MYRLFVLLPGCAASAHTVALPSKGSCDTTERRELDFWLGDWDLVVRARAAPSSPQWQEARGQNHIRSTFGGCVIEESFSADGTAANVLLPIGGQACQLQLVDVHLDATTANLDPSRFQGEMRIITSTPRPETCVCQAWFEYQANLSTTPNTCP